MNPIRSKTCKTRSTKKSDLTHPLINASLCGAFFMDAPMTEPLPTFGPPAFAFTPSQTKLSGPSFSPAFKALTWFIIAALLLWMLRLQLPWGQTATTLAWSAWAMLGFTAWTVQGSRLHIGHGLMAQDWMWRKQMGIADLSYLKVLRIRGLEWLFAPRVYARTQQGKFAVFYCADESVLNELERMRQELESWRNHVIHGT